MSQHIVIEIDGTYHDSVIESDLNRQEYIERQGWQVLRFSAEEVEYDTEAVARAIASKLGLCYEFRARKGNGSGKENDNAPQNRSNN